MPVCSNFWIQLSQLWQIRRCRRAKWLDVFSRIVKQLAATQGVRHRLFTYELHPKMKELLATGLQSPGSSRKGKPKRASTQQFAAPVPGEAVVPQSSMVEVFSRASKRLASTRSKLPHHSGLPFTNSMLPKALNISQVACSVMVLQTTEPGEEAKQFIQRQASLSNAMEAEGSSAQAESRVAQLKDDTPVGTKRDWEGQAKHAAETSVPMAGKAPAKPRLGYPDPNRTEGLHAPRTDRAWNRRRCSRDVLTNLAQGGEDAFDQMCHDANASLFLSATVAADAPPVQLTTPFQDVVSVPVEAGPAAAPVPVDAEETALGAYITPTRPPAAALQQPGAPQRRPITPLNMRRTS